jgi:hypothetical protein
VRYQVSNPYETKVNNMLVDRQCNTEYCELNGSTSFCVPTILLGSMKPDNEGQQKTRIENTNSKMKSTKKASKYT